MDTVQVLTLAGFLTTLVLITVWKEARTALVLCGAVFVAVLHPSTALSHIDIGVLGLWLGMLVLAGALRQTGLSQYLALWSAKAVRGNPVAILLVYAALALLFSAVVGSVPAMFLMVPVSLLVAVELDISPLPFVIGEAVAAGLGGALTLVGDPASMVVASTFGVDYTTYLSSVAPVLGLTAVFFFGTLVLVFRSSLKVTNERKARILDFDASRSRPDQALLTPVLGVLVLTLVGLVVAGWFQVPVALVALGGAGLLLLLTGPKDALKHLGEADWNALVFVAGLFLLVGGLLDSGVLGVLLPALALFPVPLLWFSGLLAALVDNVTAVTVLAPLVQSLAGAPVSPVPVWLPLVLGGALGGSATLFGAWANIAAAGIAGKSGYKLKFWTFTRYTLLLSIVNLLVASVVLLIPGL
ncbi:MAG: SLC13 family permease [Spirochaetales bacterium]